MFDGFDLFVCVRLSTVLDAPTACNPDYLFYLELQSISFALFAVLFPEYDEQKLCQYCDLPALHRRNMFSTC